jgi:hypothetical protein
MWLPMRCTPMYDMTPSSNWTAMKASHANSALDSRRDRVNRGSADERTLVATGAYRGKAGARILKLYSGSRPRKVANTETYVS